ncbi:MAG: PEP-CTERM sorting domain-containing protein [Verrucomicrobia bacterium]|nr:MAG: PEP-CTERM sorting domain-containing protein [Verrucomicrobiota bacterium]
MSLPPHRRRLHRILLLVAAPLMLLLASPASAQLLWVLDASSPISGNTPTTLPDGSSLLGKWDWTQQPAPPPDPGLFPPPPPMPPPMGSFQKTAGAADFDAVFSPMVAPEPPATIVVNSTSGPYTVLFAAVKAGNSYNLFSLTDSSNPLGTSFLVGPADKDISHISFYGTAAIPEPGTYALIFGAAALVFAVWRRRRSVRP